MKTSEQNIVKKLRNNDEDGLRQMFDLYYTPLCEFALKYIDSFDQAEDLVQDVFIRFWERKRADQLTGSLKAYLFTAVRNNALNLIRKNRHFRIKELDDEFDLLFEEQNDPEDFEKKRNQLYKELDNLSEQTRKVFDAIVFGNLKYKEAAEELNLSVNTIKTHFSRALKQLRSSIHIIVFILLS